MFDRRYEAGLVSHFADCAGPWRGSNGFRLMPSDSFAEAPALAALTLAARAHFTSLAYTWAHPEDGLQEGLLVFGPDAEVDSLVGLWGDSWHQQPAPMSMTGAVIEGSTGLANDYGDGWRWRIVVRVVEGPALTIRMDNVIPSHHATTEVPAGPYVVMPMHLRRPA
ncbi:MAG: hypothetical protein ACRDZW_07560 [Acidimicrobiales bacterium]